MRAFDLGSSSLGQTPLPVHPMTCMAMYRCPESRARCLPEGDPVWKEKYLDSEENNAALNVFFSKFLELRDYLESVLADLRQGVYVWPTPSRSDRPNSVPKEVSHCDIYSRG
jgi:hypothetical protein